MASEIPIRLKGGAALRAVDDQCADRAAAIHVSWHFLERLALHDAL
jgi:hypothetical protein